MIRFACPGCSATFTVGDEKAGKTGKCPKCQSQFVIPTASESAPPPSVKAPPKPAPAPAPPADSDEPVEIAPCPKCDTRLSVLPADVGLEIQCPNCETVFKAVKAGSAPKPLSKPPRPSAVDDAEDDDRPQSRSKSRRDEDEEDDDRPKRKGRRDDDDEDRPASKRGSRRGDDDEDDDRPKGKSRSSRRDDDDEDEDDRPSRRKGGSKKKGRSSGESKRIVAGVLALFLGAYGVHKFYLGYTTAGIIQILLLCTVVGAFIPVVEGIIYLTKTDEDFIDTYQRGEKQWF